MKWNGRNQRTSKKKEKKMKRRYPQYYFIILSSLEKDGLSVLLQVTLLQPMAVARCFLLYNFSRHEERRDGI